MSQRKVHIPIKEPVIWRLTQKIKKYFSEKKRKQINIKMRNELSNSEFTIISNNCIAGTIYHDLGLRFDTPTINLFFEGEDYIKFLENLEYYIAKPITAIYEKEYNYPIGYIDDIRIHFLHYKSKEEVEEKWNSRKERIHYDNLFVTMVDRDGGARKDLIERFSKLKYKKVFFSHKKLPYDFSCYIPGFKKHGQVGIINAYANCLGYRYYEKYFDIIGFLNSQSE